MRLLAEQTIHKLHNRTDAAYGCKENRNADEIIIKYTDGDKGMLNKKWKRFNKLTGKCYLNMIGTEKDGSCWLQAFELMKEIILEERKSDPQFVSELEMIDDATDYAFDIQGWLEDCLDEIDMREEYETLLKMCNDLLELFGWPEYTGSDIRFRKTTVLRELGRTKESVEFCKKWMQKEPGNVVRIAIQLGRKGGCHGASAVWKMDAKYGCQFSVEKVEETLPATVKPREANTRSLSCH